MKRFFKVPIYLGITLIVTALAGCMDLLEAPPDALAQGTGRVVVSIGDAQARTVAPDTGAFTKYTLTFSGPAAFGPVDIENSDGAAFDLQPGTWAITATAYTGTAGNYAAVAEGSAQVALSAGETVTAAFVLGPITTAAGTGVFSYSITLPAGTTGSLVIATAEGEAVEGGTIALEPGTANAGEQALAPGEYLVRVRLEQDGAYAGFTEALHIYAGLTSALPEWTCTDDDFGAYLVTNTSDSGAGSLRQALEDLHTLTGLRSAIQILLPPESVIALESALPQISKSMTIEGNGVTLTRAASWTDSSDTSQLLFINSSDVAVTIRRLHFKDGLATSYGGAIRIIGGSLTLESCIFSGNRTTSGDGGAVHSRTTLNGGNTLIIRGCTFYGNTAGYGGGAVCFNNNNGTLDAAFSLRGNLFYGNSGPIYPVALCYNLSTIAASYNVTDTEFGRGSTQCGWDQGGFGDVY